MTAALGKVLTIADVARLAGWIKPQATPDEAKAGRKRMWRHLRTLNQQAHGMLLRNSAQTPGAKPRWTVTLEALMNAAPEWFRDTAGLEGRVELLEERLEVVERVQEIHTEALARTG